MEYEKLTQRQFLAKGKELFGENMNKWKFKCPICGNIQCAEDFRQYKEQGATAESTWQECIGRYMPKRNSAEAFGNKNKKVKSPCNYAAYGLFRIGHVVKLENGRNTVAFPFAEE